MTQLNQIQTDIIYNAAKKYKDHPSPSLSDSSYTEEQEKESMQASDVLYDLLWVVYGHTPDQKIMNYIDSVPEINADDLRKILISC